MLYITLKLIPKFLFCRFDKHQSLYLGQRNKLLVFRFIINFHIGLFVICQFYVINSFHCIV